MGESDMDKWTVSDAAFVTQAAQVSVFKASAGRKRQLMKEDPNYSCSEEKSPIQSAWTWQLQQALAQLESAI